MSGTADTTRVPRISRTCGEALRYAELNPVRAKLVTEATSWVWSSAVAHCGVAQADTSLSTELWQTHWTNTSWRKYLAAGETETQSASIVR